MAKKTNIKINGKDYFRVTATVGKNPDGTPIRKQFYGESKKEAENKKDEYLLQLNKGLHVNFDKAIFINVFEKWFFEIVQNSVSTSTFVRYTSDYNLRIKDSPLSNIKLIDIKTIHIQSYYNDLRKTYTSETIKNMNKLISKFFNYCINTDLIIKNPLNGIELPVDNIIKEKYKFLKKDDINKITSSISTDINNFIFVFAIFTGLRQGEILALTHKDIDLENNIININKTVAFLSIGGNCKHILTTPKTKNSVRQIPILNDIKQLLLKHIRLEKEKHLKLGIPFDENSILFSSETCNYKISGNVNRSLKRLLKRLGIKETNFHSLRHTFCSMLVEQGVPLKTASVLMGHSNISTTANIYTHVNPEEQKNSIEKLSMFF